MRIFLARVDWYGMNCFSYHIQEALIDKGYEVQVTLLGQEKERLILRKVQNFKPDVVIVFLGYSISKKTIHSIRKLVDPVMVLWENDDPWKFLELSSQWLGLFDLYITNDPSSIPLYRRHGIDEIQSIHFGINSNYHYYEDLPKKYEVTFVGSCYKERVEFLSLLSEYDLKIWGPSEWSKTSLSSNYQGASITDPKTLRRIYSSSKINLNIHYNSMKDENMTGTFTNQRVYEILGCGGFCITDFRPQTFMDFEHGKDLVFFYQPNELPDLVGYYLSFKEERLRIAKSGKRLVQKQYRYQQLLDPLLKKIKEKKKEKRVSNSL